MRICEIFRKNVVVLLLLVRYFKRGGEARVRAKFIKERERERERERENGRRVFLFFSIVFLLVR